jgi:uncharacterized protein YcbX
MANVNDREVGRVAGIWRYPVKSMIGEELDASEMTDRGLLGDRAFALVDAETGKVASAKNPRRWPTLFDFRASYVDAPTIDRPLPPVRVTLPNGNTLTTDQADAELRLASAVGRSVRLARKALEATAEGYWPDYDWLQRRDEVFEFQLPPGTFFDCATVHVVTTATLNHLRALCPGSRFDVSRFRPNLLIETTGGLDGFIENDWVGRSLAIGDVRLRINRPSQRCVMTTLPQGSLPHDSAVLRTIVRENRGNVGVYASVTRGCRIERGDRVELF